MVNGSKDGGAEHSPQRWRDEELPRLRERRRFVEVRERLERVDAQGQEFAEARAEAQRAIATAHEETVAGDRLFARRWAPKALARYEAALEVCSDFLPAQIGQHAAKTFGPPSRRPWSAALAIACALVVAGVLFYRSLPLPEPARPSVATALENPAKAATYNQFVRLVADRPPGTLLRTFVGHTQPVSCLAVSRAGLTLASGGQEGELKLWDLGAGTELKALAGHHAEVTCLAFNTVGDKLISGGADGAVHVWENSTGERLQTLSGHTGRILAVSWGRDARHVVTVGTDSLRVWDLARGTVVRSTNFEPGAVMTATIGPHALNVMTAGGSPTKLALYDLESTRPGRPLSVQPAPIKDIAIGTDGRFAISGDTARAVTMWDLATGREVYAMEGHASGVESVAFGPDERYVLSGSDDGTVRLWDRVKMRELLKLSGPAGRVMCVSFTRGGRFAISGGEDHNLRLWKLWEGVKAAP